MGRNWQRFAIAAAAVDGRVLRRLATELPIGVNPWSTLTAAIASVDYVKRPEVLPAVAACPWDIVVVDEAHGVTGDSDRRAAVHALASRAPYVLLLTATPHNGDRRAFEALCGLGRPARRAIHRVPPHASGSRHGTAGASTSFASGRARPSGMHALLARYSAAVRGDRGGDRHREVSLALSVLHKRAFSSAWSPGSRSIAASPCSRRRACRTRISSRCRSTIRTAARTRRRASVVAAGPRAVGSTARAPAARRARRTGASGVAARVEDRGALPPAPPRPRIGGGLHEYRDTLMHLRRCLAGRATPRRRSSSTAA